VIVLDASVLIAHYWRGDAHRARADDLLRKHVDRQFAASAMTLAEFLVGPVKSGSLTKAMATLADLDVLQIDLPVDAPIRLAELRAVTCLRLPDCCVLLAAQDQNAALATFDDRLRQAALDLGLQLA